MLERQFRRYFDLAARSAENTGEQLLAILERRLDNVIHRLGFAPSRAAARQIVAHGHIVLNGYKCTIPSLLVKPNDVIRVKSRPNSQMLVKLFLQDTHREPVPDFLEVIPGENPEGRMSRLPSRSDVDPRIADIREQLIIEIVTR